MIHAIGALVQQFIMAVSLSASIFWFSPWLLVLLIVAVVPAFLGESHFAFLGYSLNSVRLRSAVNSIICVCSARARNRPKN